MLLDQFAEPFGSVGRSLLLKGAIWLQLQVKRWVSSGREVGRNGATSVGGKAAALC